MSSGQNRILRKDDRNREPREREWLTSPQKEEIRRRAIKDSERSFERVREQVERLTRRAKSGQ